MSTCDSVCRACLNPKESFNYFLFENVSPETYWFCTSVEICKNEELTKALCDNCHQILLSFAEFKQTCINSQNSLLTCTKVKTETSNCTYIEDNLAKSLGPDLESADITGNLNEDTKLEPADVTVKIEEESYHYDDLLAEDFSNQNVENKVYKRGKKKRKLKDHDFTIERNSKKVSRKPFIYRCELCSKKFRYLETFEAHKLEHEGKSPSLHCIPCNKRFVTWSGLARHREGAHTARRLASAACGACGRVCASRHSLRAHERAHARRPAAPCVCHVCGRQVATPPILKAHLETHKTDRERHHTCEHCGKKFFTNTMVLAHISRQHTGRRYICDLCNFPFTDKYNLAKHILNHEGKKPYKCDICVKAYAKNSSLVEHKRIHSGERPFGCTYCSKRFLSKRRLRDHLRTHTGEKPYKCGVCEQRFTQRGTLQRHMKVHDKSVPVLGL